MKNCNLLHSNFPFWNLWWNRKHFIQLWLFYENAFCSHEKSTFELYLHVCLCCDPEFDFIEPSYDPLQAVSEKMLIRWSNIDCWHFFPNASDVCRIQPALSTERKNEMARSGFLQEVMLSTIFDDLWRHREHESGLHWLVPRTNEENHGHDC